MSVLMLLQFGMGFNFNIMVVFENEKWKVIEFIEPSDVNPYIKGNCNFTDPDTYNVQMYDFYRKESPIYLIDDKSKEGSFIMFSTGAKNYMDKDNRNVDFPKYINDNKDLGEILLKNCEKDSILIDLLKGLQL